MSKRTLPALLSCVVVHAAVAGTPSTADDGATVAAHWSCVVADGAQARREQVIRHLLPRVVFAGETQPADVEARMARHATPALSVAVIRAGGLDWSAAWGHLQADGAPAACDSLFQGGSLAKPATVLAALRMQHDGSIDLDADIDTVLTSWHLPPGRQDADHPVTLRNLFTHTSGITPGGYEGYARGEPMPTDVQTVQALPPANGRKVDVLKVPGTALDYSGGGYTVAEIALQDRLRQPFETLMRIWLTGPVGMRQADFTQPAPAASEAHTARGHLADGSVVPGGWRNHPEQAAAGLWTTASDLAALLIELRKGWEGTSTVFPQAGVRELLATPIDGHAYGFRLIGDGDQVFLAHYGGTVGYRAGMTINLHTGDGAVYLANSDNGADLGREFLAAVSEAYGWPMFRAARVERTTQPVEVLQALAGRYGFEDGPAVSVVYEREALTLVFPNGDRYALTPIRGASRAFIHADTGVRASFDGEAAATTLQLYGETGRRIAADE